IGPSGATRRKALPTQPGRATVALGPHGAKRRLPIRVRRAERRAQGGGRSELLRAAALGRDVQRRRRAAPRAGVTRRGGGGPRRDAPELPSRLRLLSPGALPDPLVAREARRVPQVPGDLPTSGPCL